MRAPRFHLAFLLGLASLWPAAATGQPAQAAPASLRPGSRVDSPVQWRLTAFPRQPLRAGEEFPAVVQATVNAGWHLYALDEPEGGPIPLEFRVQPGGALVLVSVRADRPQREASAEAGSAVNFYVGRPRFRLRLRAATAWEPGTGAAVAVEVRFQACNERMCLPPRVAALPIAFKLGYH